MTSCFVKMFCSAPNSRWYGDEHWSNKKNHKINSKQKQVKKTHSQKPHKYQKCVSKINHELHERKHLLCNWWFQSMTTWYQAWQTLNYIHKVRFGDAEYCGHDFMYHKKHHQSHESSFMPKQHEIYTSKSHIYIWFASISKIAVWFVIPKNDYIKYLHDVFTKAPKSL